MNKIVNQALIQGKQQFLRDFLDLSAMFDHQWAAGLTTRQIDRIITGLELTPARLMLLPLSVAETLVEHGLLLDIAASRDYLASQGLQYESRQAYHALMLPNRANRMEDWVMLGNRKFFLKDWWDQWLEKEISGEWREDGGRETAARAGLRKMQDRKDQTHE